MPIKIINAPAGLKKRITELCRETYSAHREATPQDWPGNYFELAIEPFINQSFADKNGKALSDSPNLFAAVKDDAFVGYYRLSSCPTDPATEYFSVEIQDICVLPDHRRQGIAAAMIAHAKGLAERHDWDALEATVADWNVTSRQTFENEGFSVKSRKLSFGPDRPARDIPLPAAARRLTATDWFWVVFGILLVAAVFAAYLKRSGGF